MQSSSLASLRSSRLSSPSAVPSLLQSFIHHHDWTLKASCSLVSPGLDLTVTHRRADSGLIDILATAEFVITLTTKGKCAIRHSTDLSLSIYLNHPDEQVLYMLETDGDFYFISVCGNEDFVRFSKASFSDLQGLFPYRQAVLRELRVKIGQILSVDKANCEVVIRTEDHIQIWSLEEGKLRRSVEVPRAVAAFAYEEGTVAYAEIKGNDVLIRVIDANAKEVKINLREVRQIHMLDLVSNFVFFQVPNSPFTAVNFRTGKKLDCPKNTKKVLGLKCSDPLLVDDNEVISRLGSSEEGLKVGTGDCEYVWVEKLNALLVYGAGRKTVDLIGLQDLKALASIPVPKGDKVRLCVFCEETFEVIIATQRGRLEIWH